VGFEVNLLLIGGKFGLVFRIMLGILCLKTVIAAATGLASGLDREASQQLSVVLSQGGD